VPGRAAAVPVLLAEYGALRTETDRRATIQWNVLALQIASAGTIGSLALASPSRTALLLVVPLTSYVFGSRYILHDFHIKLIHRYLRDSLSVRLDGGLAWERWKDDAMAARRTAGPSGVTAWRWTHPTRLAFVGVAVLCLVGAVASGAYTWRTDRPSVLLICGFAVLAAIGAVVTVLLDRSFDRAS
jgi:hypothetical protein